MTICVIHTGGTIGMVSTDTGFAPKSGVVESELARLRQLGEISGDYRVIVADPLIDSANASPADWNWIITQIIEASEDCEGFVLTHGTDTLAFTAAALTFSLRGLQKPVLLTGAMRPLTENGSDGSRNLSDAFAAVRTAPPGVWVQFAGKRLHGARVRKSHSVAFDAFAASPSDVGPLRKAEHLSGQLYDENACVLIATVAPGMKADLVSLAAERADGIVLRCYGSGTVPERPDLRAALKRARENEIPVLAVSQCAEGGISLGTYSAGALLAEFGVIDGQDMTVEAAYTKLLHTLTVARDLKEQRRLLEQCLCGEWGT
ncbi:asparaginase [Phaeobacter sp. B1627]|uniref:asparaginase n=1 Tax=Phaeobacter sp. B1627 TaxID=2583809 RepID=UPI00111B066B|nr:asparaginase [Phaeobacter sp. B1627]TNJ45919.1 asparaginase [Phaeobacter sp. B1627]